MTVAEIARMKELFYRFIEDKFSDDPFWNKLAEGLLLGFIAWLDE